MTFSWSFCSRGCSCPLKRSHGLPVKSPCGIIAHTPPTLLPMCPACLSLPTALLLWELLGELLRKPEPAPAGPACWGSAQEADPLSLPSAESCTTCSSTGGQEEGEPCFCPQCPACSHGSALQALVQGQVVVVHIQLRPTNLPSWSFSSCFLSFLPSSAGWGPDQHSGFAVFP